MIEDRGADRGPGVEKPVPALHAVSHDPTLQHLVRLRDGRRLTAVQVQWAYLEQARKYVEDRAAPTTTRRPARCWSAGSRC